MLRYLHSLSAVLFYLLGSLFFAAYLLYHNDIAVRFSAQFLYLGQFPLLLSGMLYGGVSVYRSLQGETSSRTLAVVIGAPLLVLFVILFALRIGTSL